MGVFRLLLALSVIASHTSGILGTTMYPGGMAVQMFFMISGFYMALVLDGRYSLDAKGLKLFYSNRALRLYPAFLAVTLGIWAQFLLTWIILDRIPGNNWVADYEAMPWSTKLPLILTNWLMIGGDVFSNMFFSQDTGAVFMFPSDPPVNSDGGMTWMHGFRTIGPAWSIGTEIWFYLLVPLLVRLNVRQQAVVFALSLACRLWISHGLGRYPYFLFPAQLLFFIAGIWSLRIYRQWVEHGGVQEWHRWVTWACWLLVLIYPWCNCYLPTVLHYTIVALALPYAFLVSKDSGWDRFVGDLSYPVYLVHLWIHGIVGRWFGVNGLLVAVGSVVVSLAIMLVIERPIARFRLRRVTMAAAN